MSARAVDVMIPYYGDVPLLRAAVRSVQAQDGEDWHLTVVDDGCEPGVPEWFAGLGDPRVSYLRNARSLGVTGNFNRCVQLARAPHVVLMGCDDLMLPGYLRTVRRALRRAPQAAMVQPGVQVVDAAGRPRRSLVDTAKRHLYAPAGIRTAPALLGGEDLAVSLLRGNWLYFPSLCWRTDALRRHPFRADLGVIQDLAVVVDLLLDGAVLATDPEVCFRYRRHRVSASATEAVSGARFTEARDFFLTTATRLTRHGWPRAARAAHRHWSSRLHALTLLPSAPRAAAPLLCHAFSPGRMPPPAPPTESAAGAGPAAGRRGGARAAEGGG
ncbi:glycosyltransferase family 2 protein [Actinacidiphila paucisporea]|uniref:Glycosyl transferase family 2 n=1 Tax=Actinacidiphila paucisporea TaxID=310782 RepID=A0A1M6W8X0_9ACTN|nr:glycosyltransferase family A protein [Actinacidiphila paucisporea]SHK89946.1 Glycosyl transferase family 2 [Actinacidiphila paucisporea]